MTPDNDPHYQVLRLPKKHARASQEQPDPELGGKLIAAQSVRNAITAGLIVVIVFDASWAALSLAIGRVFPWMTLLQAALVGLAIRHAGRGLDWRFPGIAAAIAAIGALAGNIVVAAAFTAGELETGTLTVLRAVTSLTWPVFFDEVMTAADAVYALFGAAIAAFYASRHLSRRQHVSLRMWKERDGRDGGT